MASKIDFKELEDFVKRLDEAKKLDIDRFLKQSTKELGGRLQAKAVKNTPTGKYHTSTGKVGGTLKRAWITSKLRSTGDGYVIDVINPIHYASYVEYGHRTRGGGGMGWVPGKYMMTTAISEINSQTPGILDKKFSKFIKDIVEDKK